MVNVPLISRSRLLSWFAVGVAMLSAGALGRPGCAETGLLTIESDQQLADNTTGVVTAIGNVRLIHPERGVVATSRQAQYFTNEDRIVLSGDVDVTQTDGTAIRAERLIYLLDQQRAIAEPADGAQVMSQWRLQPSADSKEMRLHEPVS